MADCVAIIVDDDEDIVSSYSEILIHNGIKIAGVGNNGLDAVNLYKKHKPCCVLLDMKMPEYDGNYAIKHIKEFDPDAKIILITAYSTIESNLDDIFAVMEKPSNSIDLIDLIKQSCT